MTQLRDVQADQDARGIALDDVGVSGIRHPIVVWDRERAKQETVAEISMSVSLASDVKGAHLSRFMEALAEHSGEITMATMPHLLATLRRRLGSSRARLEVRFPYFLEKRAPVTGARALMDYDCTLSGEMIADSTTYLLQVCVPVTSVCPCSKAISDRGAHNQRGVITIQLTPMRADDGEPALIWIEEVIAIAESAASAPLYPILKRPDERYVTMHAYDNPVFVEDMVRAVILALGADPRVEWASVEATNDESIHNHAAFAWAQYRRRQAGGCLGS